MTFRAAVMASVASFLCGASSLPASSFSHCKPLNHIACRT